ncbi:kinase-like protein [Decorospora gaudefroyi]|uniref:non-specific serine/threonine protein kinase n=1 Tax=Decorospora gaudefroyi TaxID=184978 RepID=A0A6A5K5A8_9PLEO|nr:kinase-like protein [Decorospora gaudefroyi]
MAEVTIPSAVLDNYVGKLIAQIEDEYRTKSECEAANFDRLTGLLVEMGKASWALRPRTYTVLRMIQCLDVMDSFVEQALLDINFPYTEKRLPASLSEMPDRMRFIEMQDHVLSAAKDIEDIENQRHVNLGKPGDENFDMLYSLGRGGFGYVDCVRSRWSTKEFALKRCVRGKMFSRDRDRLRMFVAELNVLKKLSHEHLVRYVGSYTDPGHLGILMSPVADCDLRIFLDSKATLHRCNLLRRFYGCLTKAVQYLHTNRIRHKDIKPQNILVKGMKVLITDFGTALDWSEESGATTSGRPGPIAINYIAPEVAERESRNESSDIWSLGCVFIEMTTVLKGHTNEQRKNFFTGQFTYSPKFYANMEAVHSWLAKLESTHDDNVTISWIRSMLCEERTKRIGISNLADTIFSHQADHVYYGPCCAGDDDTDTSSHGSSPVEHAPSNSRNDDPRYSSHAREQETQLVASAPGDKPTSRPTDESIPQMMQPSTWLPVGRTRVGTGEFPGSAALSGLEQHSEQIQSPQPAKDAGGYNPNPSLSAAVSAVDQLLRPRRVQSGFGTTRPVPSSNRADALWQEAYLIHESESRPLEEASALTSAMPHRQYYQQSADADARVQQSGSLYDDGQTQHPSWNEVMSLTGISVFRQSY